MTRPGQLAEVGQADDAAAAVRVDELLARTRDGPRPLTPTGDHHLTSSPMRSKGKPGRRHGGEPEAAP
jgi:hypothetical protein